MNIKRPILFLDIDGVLNSESYMKTLPSEFYAHDAINPEAIKMLNEIKKETGCNIVLSSMWRYSYNIRVMDELFQSRGALFSLLDYTPHLTSNEIDFQKASKDLDREHKVDSDCLKHVRRGLEIELWIRRNFKNSEIPDLNIAIVDDIDNMHNLKSRLIKTDEFCGLTKDNAESIKEMLKRPLGDLLTRTDKWWYTKEAKILGDE